MADRLPLFPLDTVLFPGALLPLHVFEPRYRVLVERCLIEGALFGIALIREGAEVGGPAEPYGVGTTARIVDAVPLPDGRYEIIVRGERRFAIESLDMAAEPYLVGQVRYLDDGEEGEPTLALQGAVAEAFVDHMTLLAGLGSGVGTISNAPETPRETAYRVAAALALENPERQSLLELPSTRDRLNAELQLLVREKALLEEELMQRRARGEGERPS